MNSRTLPLAIFLVGLLVCLAGNAQHALWDRDEPRYGVATREMLETGDWIIPHFNGETRYDKPILIYWLMAGPMSLFGIGEFGARFVSGVMGALRALLVFYFARRIGCGERGALLAAALALFVPLLLVISKAATIDSTLILAITGVQWLLWESGDRPFSWRRHLALWALLGVTVLLKGPPGPLIAALTWLSLATWNAVSPIASQAPRASPTDRVLRAAVGIVAFLAVTMIWVAPAWIRTNGDFIMTSINRHVVERAKTSLEGHSGPFFYYIPVLIVTALPFTGVLLAGAAWAARNTRERTVRFLWCWIVPAVIVFSLVKTKLPHYVAPMVPAFCLMAGLWWTRFVEEGNAALRPRPWVVASGGWLAVVAGFAALGIPLGASVMGFGLNPIVTMAAGGIMGLGFCWGGVLWLQGEWHGALAKWFGGWLATLAIAFFLVLPELDAIRVSKPTGVWVRENAPPGAYHMMSDFDEPTMVFYARNRFRTMGKREWPEVFAKLNDLQTPAVLVITQTRWNNFLRDYQGPIDPRVGVRRRIDGFQIESGGPETVLIVGNW